MTSPLDEELLSTLVVQVLPPDFRQPDFDCGEPDLTAYFCDGTAASDQLAAYSLCYLVTKPDGTLVGYFAVLADAIRLATKERPKGLAYSTAPALKLGRMGVDEAFRGRGVGMWILDFVVGLARSLSSEVGVRYVTLDALKQDGLVSWYQRYGFVPNQGETDRQVAVLKFFQRFTSREDFEHVSMRFDVLLQGEPRGDQTVA